MMKARKIPYNAQTYFMLVRYYTKTKTPEKAVQLGRQAMKAKALRFSTIAWLLKAAFKTKSYAMVLKAGSLLKAKNRELKKKLVYYTTVAYLAVYKRKKVIDVPAFTALPDMKDPKVFRLRAAKLLSYCAKDKKLKVMTRVPLYRMFSRLKKQGYEVSPKVLEKLKAAAKRVKAAIKAKKAEKQPKADTAAAATDAAPKTDASTAAPAQETKS